MSMETVKTMTHADVIEFNEKLKKVKGLKGADLNYAIKYNLKKLKPHIEVYAEQENEIREIVKEFNEERTKIQEQYATVDGKVKKRQENKDGQMYVTYDIPADKVQEVEAKIEELKVKHKEKLDSVDLKWKELVDSRTKGKTDFEIFTVKRHHIPADISTEDMDLIFDMIKANE